MARKSGSDGQKTARDLRDAALRLFAEHGYAAVSMRQIAREVGVQAGALYLYTPDKQSLLQDLMCSHLEALLKAWADRRSSLSSDPAERLEAFVEFHIHYHLTRVDEVFIAYMELRNLDQDGFRKVEDLRRQYERELEAILSDGRTEAAFRIDDLRVTTLAAIAMLTGVTTWYREDGRLTPDRIAQEYRGLIFSMVGAA